MSFAKVHFLALLEVRFYILRSCLPAEYTVNTIEKVSLAHFDHTKPGLIFFITVNTEPKRVVPLWCSTNICWVSENSSNVCMALLGVQGDRNAKVVLYPSSRIKQGSMQLQHTFKKLLHKIIFFLKMYITWFSQPHHELNIQYPFFRGRNKLRQEVIERDWTPMNLHALQL